MNKQTFAEDDFLINDPEKRPGVILNVPSGVVAVRLEPVGYFADTDVRCSFCPQRQKHRRGFFAVLPDESLALCGNCCAVKIAGKSTVAKIKREIKRREEAAATKKDIALLAAGLAPVIETLERDWLPIEREIYRSVNRLNECFMSIKPPRMAKLSAVADGLKKIASLEIIDPEAVKRKRERALTMIDEGISEIQEELSKLDYNDVRRLVHCDEPVHGYIRTNLHGRSLYLLNSPSWADPELHDGRMEEHMTIPKIHLPDPGPLRQAVEAARFATE